MGGSATGCFSGKEVIDRFFWKIGSFPSGVGQNLNGGGGTLQALLLFSRHFFLNLKAFQNLFLNHDFPWALQERSRHQTKFFDLGHIPKIKKAKTFFF